MSGRACYALADDGSPLFYDLRGEEHADTVVLCDGIGCDGYVWKYLEGDLASAYRLIHWHYPGHGRSPKPRDPSRIAISDLADDLRAVLDDSDTGGAVVIGHSMGVQVALETYRRHPERVAALVLVCGAPATPLKTFRGSAAMESLLPRIQRTVNRAPALFSGLARAVLETDFSYRVATRIEVNGELIDPRDFMPYLRGLSRIEAPYFLAMLAEAGKHSALDVLPTIDVPALIIAGARDGFTPVHLSKTMAAAIPGAEILIVEDGSHTAPLERPEAVRDKILTFLQQALSTAS